MATIKDVANNVGVSICTVSRALANKNYVKPETRERVLQAAKELGYKPNYIAKSLREGNTRTIGLILPDIANMYYPKIAKYIERYFADQGYMILLCNANRDIEKEVRLVEMLKSRDVDGVLVWSSFQKIDHFQSFAEANIPYVFVNRDFKQENCVPCDNFYGGYSMIRYLIENGHRRICAMFPSFENPVRKECYAGAVKATEECPDCHVDYIFDAEKMEVSHDQIEEHLQVGTAPTAFFAASDMIAISLYTAIQKNGWRIPEDISVVGYDNISFTSMLNPPMTTFEQTERELAKAAVDALLALIAGEKIQSSKKLQGKIIIRDSVLEIGKN